jgi:mercuric ion transport protein
VDHAAQENESQSDMANNGGGRGAAAAGGLLGAILASSCCLLPLTLSVLGLTGAWMSSLRALAPLQPFFLGLSALLVAYGFYQVYGKTPRLCREGMACSMSAPSRLVKGALWTAAILITLSISFGLWFPLLEPYLP